MGATSIQAGGTKGSCVSSMREILLRKVWVAVFFLVLLVSVLQNGYAADEYNSDDSSEDITVVDPADQPLSQDQAESLLPRLSVRFNDSHSEKTEEQKAFDPIASQFYDEQVEALRVATRLRNVLAKQITEKFSTYRKENVISFLVQELSEKQKRNVSEDEANSYFQNLNEEDREAVRNEAGISMLRMQARMRNVVYSEPHLGKAKLNQVDGVFFIRVVIESNQCAYLFLPQDVVQLNSPHLRQIVARNHYDAGFDPVTNASGRNTYVVSESTQGAVESAQYSEKIGFSEPGGKREWKDATFERPSADDASLGIANGIMQTATTALAALASSHIDHTPYIIATPAVSFVYGTVIGVFIKSYKRWITRGSRAERQSKNLMVSISNSMLVTSLAATQTLAGPSMGVMLTAIANGQLSTLTSVSLPLLQQILWKTGKKIPHILVNTYISTFGKSTLNQIPRTLEITNTGSKIIEVPVLKTKWSRSSFNFQAVTFYTQNLRFADLLGVGGSFFKKDYLWGTLEVTPGKLLLLMNAPLAKPFVAMLVRRAEKKALINPELSDARKAEISKIREKLDEDIEKTFIKPMRATSRFLKAVVLAPLAPLMSIKRRSQEFYNGDMLQATADFIQNFPEMVCSTAKCLVEETGKKIVLITEKSEKLYQSLNDKYLKYKTRDEMPAEYTLEQYIHLPLKTLAKDPRALEILAEFKVVLKQLEADVGITYPQFDKKIEHLQAMIANPPAETSPFMGKALRTATAAVAIVTSPGFMPVKADPRLVQPAITHVEDVGIRKEKSTGTQLNQQSAIHEPAQQITQPAVVPVKKVEPEEVHVIPAARAEQLVKNMQSSYSADELDTGLVGPKPSCQTSLIQ